jgi:hypothetical protein
LQTGLNPGAKNGGMAGILARQVACGNATGSGGANIG